MSPLDRSWKNRSNTFDLFSLAIGRMFGGFSSAFYDEYHSHLPKSEPINEYDERPKLYQLFHYLNHTVLFGVSFTFATPISSRLSINSLSEWIRRAIHFLGESTTKFTPKIKYKRPCPVNQRKVRTCSCLYCRARAIKAIVRCNEFC